jgi:transglutaminase-like putative cysteine protease
MRPRESRDLRLLSSALSPRSVADAAGLGGFGATHAWAEIFLPGAGWITFDPTNRSVGGANLIPVAVARDIRQAMPLVGSFAGSANAFLDMSVEVSVGV